MALQIGVVRYTSNADLRRLCEDANFLKALGEELGRIGNEGERQRANDRARRKLEKWVLHQEKYQIPWGAKAQGKSFSSYQAAVKWLLYKTQKSFANNQQQETRLAEEIHSNARIKALVLNFLRGPLATWWTTKLSQDQRKKLGSAKGRYSPFYSKVFCNRTISEGFEYFSLRGAGLFSKNVTEKNFSISEAAAFVADVALASKSTCGLKAQLMDGLDNIRLNLTIADQRTREALDATFTVLMPKESIVQAFVKKNAIELGKFKNYSQGEVFAKIGTQFKGFKDLIGLMVARDSALAKVFPDSASLVDEGLGVLRQANECKDLQKQLNLIQDKKIVEYLTKPRPQDAEVTRLKKELQAELDAVRNKVPGTLKSMNPGLYALVSAEGMKRTPRSNFNVDPDHEWTKFMINKNAVVGAGPSGTTSWALGLVRSACEGSLQRAMALAEYAVAMALFSFWQRKKSLLKYHASVHTWNEVCAALDHHRGEERRIRDGFLTVADTGKLNDDSGYNLYNYPYSFSDLDGLPVYTAGADTWEGLMG
jgi:hypothetical protein